MSWQEREREIDEALSVLKNLQQSRGRGRKEKKRVHLETRLRWAAAMVALKSGNCRTCSSLNIEIYRGERKGVGLNCETRDPIKLHYHSVYSPAEIPSCDLLVPFEEEEQSTVLKGSEII